MKKAIIILLTVSLFGISCHKSDTPAPAASVKYMSLTAGSTWNYELVDSTFSTTTPYVITSTSKDSSINGKQYHVFTNSSGSGNEYYNISGSDYYNFISLPAALGGSHVEFLYLKDNAAVGSNWSQTYPINYSGISFNATFTNTITEKGISKTVKGIAYSNVIHVTTAISVTAFGQPLPAGALKTNIETFYAEKIGLILSNYKINLNYSGTTSNTNQQTNLNASNVK